MNNSISLPPLKNFQRFLESGLNHLNYNPSKHGCIAALCRIHDAHPIRICIVPFEKDWENHLSNITQQVKLLRNERGEILSANTELAKRYNGDLSGACRIGNHATSVTGLKVTHNILFSALWASQYKNFVFNGTAQDYERQIEDSLKIHGILQEYTYLKNKLSNIVMLA